MTRRFNRHVLVERYTQLEARIRELGGTVPKRWPWADLDLQNLQLLETVEDLEAAKRKQKMENDNASQ